MCCNKLYKCLVLGLTEVLLTMLIKALLYSECACLLTGNTCTYGQFHIHGPFEQKSIR